MKYSKILVAFDGSEMSEKALLQAKELAKADQNAAIHVLCVWNTPVSHVYESSVIEQLSEYHQKYAQQAAEKAKAVLEDLLNPIKTVVRQGYPATEIVAYAEEENVDLIVVGSRGLGGVKKWLLGSVSYYVVQKAKCQVLVVK